MMKKYHIISFLVLLASCTSNLDVNDSNTEPSSRDAGEMIFMARAATLTRASSNGLYNQTYYPVNRLFLTSFHRDNLNFTQWYFQDIMLDATDSEGNKITDDKNILVNGEDPRCWTAKGWYWPIQGKMELLSYWSPKVSGSPEFHDYVNGDDGKSAQMVVKSRTASSQLDGKTDFLYIAENKIPCPQNGPLAITYKHGLAWITLSLRAEVIQRNTDGTPVLDASGNTILDEVETQKLIDKVHVQKIVIEDVSRNGTAYLVPGFDVAWTIDPDDINDQVYFRPKGAGQTRGNYGYFDWEERKDGSLTIKERDYITLSTKKQYLGLYVPTLYSDDENAYQPETNTDLEYIGNGLLLIPQHKTAITVYYQVENGKLAGYDAANNPIYETLPMIERYDLHDNNEEWEPGKRYNYDIIFNTSAEDQPASIEIVPTTFSIVYGTDNPGFTSGAFGDLRIKIEDGEGNVTYQDYEAPVFLLPPLHDQGSPFQDEMDYRDGGNI